MTRYGAHVRPRHHLPRRGPPADLDDPDALRRGGRRGDPGRAVRRRHLHTGRAPGSGRWPSGRPTTCRMTAPARTWRCASTPSRTSGSSTRATSRCAPGEIERARRGAGGGRARRAPAGADPPRARRRPLDRAAGRDRGGPPPRVRTGLDDPLRRPRRHRRHRVRLALRPRPADAAADRVRRAARRPVPADGAARLLARPGDARRGWPSRTCGPTR